MTYKANLLWVDDEPDILDFFKRFWDKRGYKVVTFERGFDALEELKKNDYDLFVTDFNRPEMDGRELILKAKELKPDLLTILFSGSEEIIKIAEEIGCDAWIRKPPVLEQFESTIEKVLKKGKGPVAKYPKMVNLRNQSYQENLPLFSQNVISQQSRKIKRWHATEDKNTTQLCWILWIILYLAWIILFCLPYFYSQLSEEDLLLSRDIFFITLGIWLTFNMLRKSVRSYLWDRLVKSKEELTVPVVISIIVLIIPLWIDVEKAYYQLLRLIVTGVSAFSFYRWHQKGSRVLSWVFAFIAILFNPIIPVNFSKSLWGSIDLFTVSFFLIQLIIPRGIKERF